MKRLTSGSLSGLLLALMALSGRAQPDTERGKAITTNKAVWDYLSQFTEWNGYVHRVLARVRGKTVPLPISLETMERLFDRPFTAEQLAEYFEQRRVKLDRIENARDVVVSQVGEELYDLFFRNYTKKQWGLYPEELAAEVTKRLPVRLDSELI